MTTSRFADRMVLGAIGAAELARNTASGALEQAAALDAQADWYAEQGDRETATDLRYQARSLRQQAQRGNP